jgi:hypothetical protein
MQRGGRGGGRGTPQKNHRRSQQGRGYEGRQIKAIVAGEDSTQPKLRLYPPGSGLYSNWFTVKENWKSHICVKYGTIASKIIPLGEYPPAREMPVWEAILARFGPAGGGTEAVAEKAFETQCSRIVKDELNDDETKPKIFQWFHSMCYDDVKEKLEADDGWDDVNDGQDPVQWYLHADRIMSTPISGDIAANIRSAEKSFNEYRQGEKQTLIEYKRGFDNRWQQCTAVGAPDRDDEYLCSAFIRGLHPAYSSLIEAYDNNLMGDGRPGDVSSAYQTATRWKTVKVSKSTHTAGDATVFVTTLTSRRGGGRGGRSEGRGGRGGGRGGTGRGRGGGRGGEESTTTTEGEGKAEDNRATEEAWRALTSHPRGSCFKCWRQGHYIGECTNDFHPNYVRDAHGETVTFKVSTNGIFNHLECVLDTASGINLVKDVELGWNFRPALPINVIGINGTDSPAQLDIMCETVFGPAYMSIANIISAGTAWDHGWSRTRDDWHDEDILSKDGKKLHFSRKGRHNVYTCFADQLVNDYALLTTPQPTADDDSETLRGLGLPRGQRNTIAFPNFETARDRQLLLSRRELARVDEARLLFKRYGYPSITSMMKLIRHGKIRDCKLTPADIVNCIHVHGPALARLRGMSTRQRRPFESQDLLGKYIDEDITLDVDVMFCEGVPFLLGVVMPLELVLSHYLKSRSLNQVRVGVLSFKSQINSLGFRMNQLRCDGEGAVSALAPELNAVVVNQTGADTHLGTVDAAIKKVKNVVRGHLAISPFNFPFMLIVFLVFYAVSRVNFWPTTVYPGCVTPMELAYGRQFDVHRDGPCYFTERVEVQERTSNSVSTPRTRPGLWVGSVGNQSHSQRIWMLDTLKTRKVDQFTPLPMDDDTIAKMNSLAAADQRKVRRDPQFRRGKIVIEFEEDDTALVSEMMQLEARRPSHRITETSVPDHFPIDSAGQANSLEPTDSSSRRSDIPPQATTEAEPEPEPEPVEPPIATELVDPPSETIEVVQPSANTHIRFEDEDLADLFDPIADPQDEPEAPPDPPDPSTGRYNLRPRRHRGLMQEDQRFRDYELGLHISVDKATELYGDAATESIFTELRKLHGKGTMQPINIETLNRQQRRTIITSKMFLKEKFKSTGDFEKLKSRFVAGGHRQDRSVYEDWETTSPTVGMSSVYMLAALAAKEGRQVMTIDVGNAYLNAAIQRDVFMRIEPTIARMLAQLDPSYATHVQQDGSIVVKLKKALYGCVESSQLWYDNIRTKLLTLGFVQNRKDACVFNKVHNGKQLTVALYVDDLMCTCVDPSALEWLYEELLSEYHELNVHRGSFHSYLGQSFDFTTPGKVRVTMEGYIKDLLTLYEVNHNCATPALSNLFTIDTSSPLLTPLEAEEFHSRVAKLLYLAKRVRPDILTAVIFLSTRVKCATTDDNVKLNRVLGYLNSTCEMGLVLEGHKALSVIAYVDASYGVHADLKSHTGGIITLGDGAVWSKSTRQKLNTKSSTEAELVAAADVCSQVIWTRDFLLEQGYKVGPASIMQDNTSTIHLISNGSSNAEKTRHISIRFFWMKDRIESNEIEIAYCPTADMVADVLTKPLQGDTFRQLRRRLLNWEY